MKKRLLLIGGIILLSIGIWLAFDSYHYSPPGMEAAQVKRLAEKELRKLVPDLLQQRDPYGPYIKKQLRGMEVLDVREINGRTYLVFKVDFDSKGPGYPYDSGGYMVGLRLVEKSWGGISLRDGMEFTASYLAGPPVECGHLPEDGVFYGFCKDPGVDRGWLELDGGKKMDLAINNRTILTGVPRGPLSLTPHFYDRAGNELEPGGVMRVAFLSGDEKNVGPYTNMPLQWWVLNQANTDYLTAGGVDAVWVFPDQHQGALQGKAVAKLKELVQNGIPVVFIGMKDLDKVIEVFGVSPKGQTGSEVDPDDIEGVYVGKHRKGLTEAGVIALDDGSQVSPYLEKSVELRYQLDLPTTRRAGRDKAADRDARLIREKMEQRRAIP